MLNFLNYNEEKFLIAHFQGTSRNEHYPAVAAFSAIENIKLPSDVTILTFATKQILNDAMLIKQLTANGISFVNPAEKIKDWHNPLKISLAAQALAKINTEYTLVLDAADVLLTGDISDIVSIFNGYGKKILFGATKTNHPNVLIDKIEQRDWLGEFRYLNAGTAFGKTSDLLEFYKKAGKISKTLDNPYDSEQFVIRHAFAENPDTVGFDWKCRIFQTFGKTTGVQTGETVVIK